MNRETRTRWYNHKCSKCSAHPFVIIIRIVLYALVRYLRPTLYNLIKNQPFFLKICSRFPRMATLKQFKGSAL